MDNISVIPSRKIEFIILNFKIICSVTTNQRRHIERTSSAANA